MDLWRAMKRGAAKARQRARATGQKPEDMMFTITQDGVDENDIQSVQEFNASGKTLPFVCMRTSTKGAYVVPGSTMTHCDGCRAEVWMSPATKEMFDKVALKVIMCLECSGVLKPGDVP